jgi:hypothetical protein
MISALIDVFLFTLLLCVTIITVSATILLLKDFKDDMH